MQLYSALVCALSVVACAADPAEDKHPEAVDHESDADADEDPEPPAYLLPGAFAGTMNTTNIYDGSLGHYEEDCVGDASFTIDEGFVIDGIGSCATSWLEMGFFIEGTQDDHAVSGNLVAENETDRVETPFTGTRDADGVELAFDATHVNEGEQLRIVGTISVAPVPSE